MSSKVLCAIVMYWYPYVGAIQPIYRQVFGHLSDNGYRVEVVAGVPHYRKGRRELWREYRGVFYRKSTEDRLHVKRAFVLSPRVDLGFDRNGTIRRFINYISFFFSAFLVSLFARGPKPSVVFALTSPPVFGGLLGLVASAVKKTPLVYNVQDVYPDILRSLKLFRCGPLYYLIQGLERCIYARARCIVAVSEKVKETLEKKGVPPGKIRVIPNFCDTELVRPLPKDNEFAREYGLHDRFAVLYAGNMGEPQGIEFVIRAARSIEGYADILFAFVGRGEKKEEAESLARECGLKNMVFIPLQPFERMPLVWASADIGLVPLRKNISHLVFPSKIFGILASGTPVISMVDKGSEIWEFVERSRGGLCVESEDVKGLADAVVSLYKDPALRARMQKQGRAFVEEGFSKTIILEKYRELFDEMCR